MRAGRMAEIAAGHTLIEQRVTEVFPTARNVLCADSMVTYDKIAAFRDDARLEDLIDQATRGLSDNDVIMYKKIAWRTHVLTWAARHALCLDGDFVEFGVFHGHSAQVVARYVDFVEHADKTWWLYDTFDGVPPDQKNTGGAANSYLFEAYKEQSLFDFVVGRFHDTPNVRVIKGRIPEVLGEACPDRVAFLHIDMNSALAERDGLAAIFDRLIPGALVVFDDYGRISYRENHDLISAYAATKGHFVLELPTGQGLLLKH